MTLQKVKIYTDGACQNNPGKGGFGIILFYKDKNSVLHTKEFSKGFIQTTNNRMELMAVIEAIKILKKPCEIELYSDSKYVVDAVNNKWIEGWQEKNWRIGTKNPVKNIDLWKKFLEVSKDHKIEFIWVKGHSSNEFNNKCDKLAVQARESDNLEKDEGFIE